MDYLLYIRKVSASSYSRRALKDSYSRRYCLECSIPLVLVSGSNVYGIERHDLVDIVATVGASRSVLLRIVLCILSHLDKLPTHSCYCLVDVADAINKAQCFLDFVRSRLALFIYSIFEELIQQRL